MKKTIATLALLLSVSNSFAGQITKTVVGTFLINSDGKIFLLNQDNGNKYEEYTQLPDGQRAAAINVQDNIRPGEVGIGWGGVARNAEYTVTVLSTNDEIYTQRFGTREVVNDAGERVRQRYIFSKSTNQLPR